MVTGCLSAADRGDEDDAEVFALNGAAAAITLSEEPAPQGIGTYRLLGLLPDLRRHIGHQVEIIGLIQEASSPSDGSTQLTLDVKSLRTTADACSR